MAVFGVIADIHGNLEALTAVLAALDARGVDAIVCLGDLVGYNADPNGCIAALRRRGVASIAGNHDLIATRRLTFDRCSIKAMHALKATRRMLSRESIDYLRGLPAHRVVDGGVLLTHGGVRDVQQYMTRPEHFAENAHHLAADFPGVRICFFGHTHGQRAVRCGSGAVNERDCEEGRSIELSGPGIHFVNPGSVDAARNSAKFAAFAVIDTGTAALALHRVAYDHELAEAKAAAAGLRIAPWRERLYDVGRGLARRAGRIAAVPQIFS